MSEEHYEGETTNGEISVLVRANPVVAPPLFSLVEVTVHVVVIKKRLKIDSHVLTLRQVGEEVTQKVVDIFKRIQRPQVDKNSKDVVH